MNLTKKWLPKGVFGQKKAKILPAAGDFYAKTPISRTVIYNLAENTCDHNYRKHCHLPPFKIPAYTTDANNQFVMNLRGDNDSVAKLWSFQRIFSLRI